MSCSQTAAFSVPKADVAYSPDRVRLIMAMGSRADSRSGTAVRRYSECQGVLATWGFSARLVPNRASLGEFRPFGVD